MHELEVRSKRDLGAYVCKTRPSLDSFFSVRFARCVVSIYFDESDTFNHALFSIKQ